jgi:cystathionine beta-lyase/cystathionine gamma-synthase
VSGSHYQSSTFAFESRAGRGSAAAPTCYRHATGNQQFVRWNAVAEGGYAAARTASGMAAVPALLAFLRSGTMSSAPMRRATRCRRENLTRFGDLFMPTET